MPLRILGKLLCLGIVALLANHHVKRFGCNIDTHNNHDLTSIETPATIVTGSPISHLMRPRPCDAKSSMSGFLILSEVGNETGGHSTREVSFTASGGGRPSR